MRVIPEELVLWRLEGYMPLHPPELRRRLEEWYSKPEEECFEWLRDASGMNFGKDLAKWRVWVEELKSRT